MRCDHEMYSDVSTTWFSSGVMVTTDSTKSLSVLGDEKDNGQLAGCAKNVGVLRELLVKVIKKGFPLGFIAMRSYRQCVSNKSRLHVWVHGCRG